MTLHEAGRWYLPSKGNSKENFLIMRFVMETKKQSSIAIKQQGLKFMISGLSFTYPQGMFLPSLPLSQELSLMVLLPEETDESQLLPAM